MKDEKKPKAQLIEEVVSLRQQVAELKALAAKHKQVEEALGESEEQHRLLLNSITDGCWVLDEEWRYTLVNEAGARMVAMSPDQLVGHKLTTLFPGIEQTDFFAAYERSMKKRTSESISAPFAFSDGRTGVYEVQVYPVPGGILCIGRDITERKRAEEALRESEHKFRSVVEQSHDGIAVVDEQGIVAEWNQAMEQCTGLKAEEVVGRPIWDVQFQTNPEEQRTPEAYEQLRAGLLAFLKTGQAPWANRLLEREYQHPDGTSRVIQGTIYSIKTDKGFILVSVARDVTEHRRADEALRESEERYRRLVESSDDLIFGVDRQGIFRTAGGARLRAFGLKPEDVVNRSLYDLFPEEEARQYQERHEQIFESGTGMTYEHSFEFAGVTKTDLTTLYPIKDERGQVELIGGICRDITERKRGEKALRESQRLLEMTFTSLHDAVFIINADTVEIVDCNPAASQIFGYDREEMLGRTTTFLHINEAALEEFRSHLYPALKEKGFLSLFEFKMKRKDGTIFPTEHSVVPLKGEQDKRVGWVSVVRDITERKRAEEQIQASLREKVALLREVHHRVKNNLQVICALLDLQADAVENEQVRVAFQESRDRIRSMAQIHEQLTHAENLAQIDMVTYIQELVASLRLVHGTDTVAIKIDVSEVTLPFDAVSPCGLLINELVSNALKHAFPPNPPSVSSVKTEGKAEGKDNEIRIMLRSLPEDENKMVLSVSDNGVGLPAEVDLENPTTLGLTLVNLLTRQLNATLEVEREAGTRFTVVFAP